jgi:hypothetical protein
LSSKKYDEELVRIRELLFDHDFSSGWEEELNRLNEKKEGAKYLYPNSLMNMLAAIHVYLLPYRQIEGFLRVFAEHIDMAKDVTIAVDSTGIKVSNRVD